MTIWHGNGKVVFAFLFKNIKLQKLFNYCVHFWGYDVNIWHGNGQSKFSKAHEEVVV